MPWRQVYKRGKGLTWEWQLGPKDKPKDVPEWYRVGFEHISGALPSMVYRNGEFYNVRWLDAAGWPEPQYELVPRGGYLVETANLGFRGIASN